MPIDRDAMLIKVTIHHAKFNKIDRRVGREIAQLHSADEDMGKYTKSIFSKEDIQSLQAAINKVQPFVYSYTLPWLDGGWRLLPVGLFDTVTEGLRDLNQDIDEIKKVFCQNIEDHKHSAEQKLGSLFNPSDYPSPEEIRAKVGTEVFFNPVPTSGDIRVDASKDIIEDIKKNIEENADKALKEAMKNIWDRVFFALERLRDRMRAEAPKQAIRYTSTGKIKKGEEKPRLFNSMLEEIQMLVDILPELNIENDPKLEDVRRKMEREFVSLSIEDLREDEDYREETAEKVDKILDNLQGVI